MKRAVVMTHADFEGPGRIGSLLVELGYQVDHRSLHRGDPIPLDVSLDEPLVVMGGPMGVGDVESGAFPYLRLEIDLLRRRIEERSPVLGVCLGAQLLARAAGATVRAMTHSGSGERLYEVGWSPVQFHVAGEDEVLGGMPAEATVLHWHGDSFDLPRRARLLASSALCRNQAFRLGDRLFGLQFHCETSEADVARFLSADADFVRKAVGDDGFDRIRRETSEHVGRLRDVGDRLLRNILRAMSG